MSDHVLTSLLFSLISSLATGLPAQDFLAPQLGEDNFRISFLGPDGNPLYDANDPALPDDPAIAFNRPDNQYLVAWWGDDTTTPSVNDEFEIYGRLVSADGQLLGQQLKISDTGPPGNADFDALTPSVTFNPDDREFMVVWRADDLTTDLVNNEFEIFGRRIAPDGAFLSPVLRLSFIGPNGDPNFAAALPEIVYNARQQEYFLTYAATASAQTLAESEFEIFGQRLGRDAALIGPPMRLTRLGPDGDNAIDAFDPHVAWNEFTNRYLIVFERSQIFGPGDTDSEIHCVLLAADGSTLTETLQLTRTGGPGVRANDAFDPFVAANPIADQYLVVWVADETRLGLANGEFEVFGQLIDANGATATQVLRLSRMGPDGSPQFTASSPRLAANLRDGYYLVAWSGDADAPPGADNRFEIFGQAVSINGDLVGPENLRISSLGPAGEPAFDALSPNLAWNTANGEFLLAFVGDDNRFDLSSEEHEIFGQRLDGERWISINNASPNWLLVD